MRQMQIGNERAYLGWMTTIAARTEQPVSVVMDAVSVETLPLEIAAILLATARHEAQRIADLPATKRASALRALRLSPEMPDRVAYALYEARKKREPDARASL